MDLFISILKLFGGLALLIYGMKSLSSQLKKLSGSKLEKILVTVTDNPFKGLLVGFLITVATQSSAATTVIVVSLVNSGILQLRNSIPIIMGANIGTTINSQILRLANIEGSSFISLLSPATFAPVLLVIGLIVMDRAKKQKNKDIGQVILSLGLLFTGMITMVNIASSFSDLPILGVILQKLSNPILGVLAGAIVTAIVQSSAATVGILQAFSTTGIITYSTTIPVILGQNIGTCVTSIFASMGANKNAKRVAAVHLYFNLIGTLIFLIFIYTYQHFIGFSFWNSPVDMGGIANFHTIFNVLSTIILFPFIKLIEKLTMITVKDDSNEDSSEDDYLLELNKLDEGARVMSSIAIANSVSVINKMGEVTSKNFTRAMELLDEFDPKKLERIHEREDIVDKMEERLTRYLVSLGTQNLSRDENLGVNSLIRIQSEIEKVADYSYALAKTIEHMHENDIVFSERGTKSVKLMYSLTENIMAKTFEFLHNKDIKIITDIQALKEVSEIRREKYKTEHILRLKKGECNVDSGIAYLEIFTIYEKVADHCFNISISLYNFITHEKYVTKQDYIKKIYKINSDKIKEKLSEYSLKYGI